MSTITILFIKRQCIDSALNNSNQVIKKVLNDRLVNLTRFPGQI